MALENTPNGEERQVVRPTGAHPGSWKTCPTPLPRVSPTKQAFTQRGARRKPKARRCQTTLGRGHRLPNANRRPPPLVELRDEFPQRDILLSQNPGQTRPTVWIIHSLYTPVDNAPRPLRLLPLDDRLDGRQNLLVASASLSGQGHVGGQSLPPAPQRPPVPPQPARLGRCLLAKA